MKSQNKHKYVSCELRVTQFQVEREFAVVSNPVNVVGTQMLMYDKDNDGHYQNEQYEEGIFNWAAEKSSVKTMSDF